MVNQDKVKNLNLYLVLIFGLVFFLQVAKINRPYLGHFSSYQAGMINLAQNMDKEGPKGWLYPKLNQIIAGEPGLHLNQYPTPSLIASISHQLIPAPYEILGRLQMIIFHLFSLWFFYLILKSLWNEKIALLGLSIYALSPYALIYGQCFLNEAPSVFFFFWGLYILVVKRNSIKTKHVFLSGILFSISVVGRIHYAVMILPFLYLLLKYSKRKILHFLLFSALSVSLPVLWYYFVYLTIQTHANVQMHMFMQVNAGKILTKSLLESLGYYKFLFDTVTGRILTPFISPFFLIGLFVLRTATHRRFILSWLVTFILIAVLVPKKVMDHEFYLLPSVPALFLVAAFGIERSIGSIILLFKRRNFILYLLIFLLVSARYFLHPLYVFPENEKMIVDVANELKRIIPKNETIVVAHGGAPELLYYSDRNGWPFNEKGQSPEPIYWRTNKFEKMSPDEIKERSEAYKSSVAWLEYVRKQDADHFVAFDKSSLEGNKALFEHLSDHYEDTPSERFYLFHLKRPKK